MSFDSTAKSRYLPASLTSLSSGHYLRSPRDRSYADKDYSGNLTTSFNKYSIEGHHKREPSTVIHPVPYETFRSPKIDELEALDKRTKKSPKKKQFFSDYMKDFNPTPREYKSPVSQNFKISALLEAQARGAGYQTSSYSKGIFNQKESVLNIGARARSPEVINSNLNSQRWKKEHYPSPRGQAFAGRDDENREKRLKENKKDDIRQRLSHLSDKLYSPGRSVSHLDRRKSELPDETLERAFTKESYIPLKDNSPFVTQPDFVRENLENGDITLDKISPDYNAQAAIENLDSKYQVMVQEYENNMVNLKNHVRDVEKSNTKIVNKLREELITSQEQINRHRAESFSKNEGESGYFGNDKNYELEDQVRREKSKTRQVEQKLEDTKMNYEKKLADMNREIEKVKIEKERKNDEINSLLKSKTQSQRDIIEKLRTENETMIRKLREEHHLAVKDFNAQIEKKNYDLEKLQREKGDLLNTVNEKTLSLQELTKNSQETSIKLNQTIAYKNNEIEKLSRALNESKKGYSILNTKTEALDKERTRLEEENERLQAKVSRLEKTIYGKDKNPSPRFES